MTLQNAFAEMLAGIKGPTCVWLKLFKLGLRTQSQTFHVASVIRISRKPGKVAWAKLYVCQVRESGRWKVAGSRLHWSVGIIFQYIDAKGLKCTFQFCIYYGRNVAKVFSTAHRPLKWFSCLVTMFHILWMAATKGGFEIAFVSKAATLWVTISCSFPFCFFLFFGNLITALMCPENCGTENEGFVFRFGNFSIHLKKEKV